MDEEPSSCRRTALAWAAALAALAVMGASSQDPSFRTSVDLVSLDVTVTDRDGRLVTDLGERDFTVFEDGISQTVRYFSRANLPISLSVLLDTSASMEDKLAAAQEAAVGFTSRIRTDDLAEVIDFDTKVEIAQGFTNRTDLLEQAIRRTSVGGTTALYNAVYIALKELRRVGPATSEPRRRQAIILLSDGEDTSSLVEFDEVLDLTKRSETAVYAIGLRSKAEPKTKRFHEADVALRELTQQTGGRVFFASRIDELAGVYAQIADELARQYAIGYVSGNARRDGGWRRVAVRLARPGLTARAKLGYYAPGLR